MSWLLIFVPITIALEHWAHEQAVWIFLTAALAIIPLAAWMGRATEQIAERTGEGIGGLLNATFGNAAELIIAIAALRGGLYGVVKASLAGSIIGNVLLVLGAAMLAGGLGRSEQRYNAAGVRSQTTMLTLAAIALIVPAAYQSVTRDIASAAPGPLSAWISITLLVVYAANLVFSLGTHRALFAGEAGGDHEEHGPSWSAGRAVAVLGLATAGIAWVSEILVGALEPTAAALGMSHMFIGVFVVAILGNAAEHSTAIVAALKNRMDLAFSIGIGSSVQVALFVAPLLVLLSYVIAPAPMDLAFPPGLVLTVLLSVWICGQLASDGRSDWLRGVQLLAVYLILALVYFYVPEAAPR